MPLATPRRRPGPQSRRLQPLCLLEPDCYPHPVGEVELVETHISWVFLAGDYAYKIKKPLHLPFLDARSLLARRRYCEAELRLNRRTAPALYLDVVAVTGTPARPQLGGRGKVIDYALRMRRFDKGCLALELARHGELDDRRIDALAAAIAGFHGGLPAAPKTGRQGTQARVLGPALQNLAELQSLVDDPARARTLQTLRTWTRNEGERLAPDFARRKREGRIRECHGDLHLGNIAWVDGRPLAFDCIEFNAQWRWSDVMSDVGFLTMDLIEHHCESAAWRFLNAYLELTGDYSGLRVLRYYLVYRALVRAKVALLRERQVGSGMTPPRVTRGVAGRYLALAGRLARPPRPFVLLMHGFSGSGKSVVSQRLAEMAPAIRVRSDVERKRLYGLKADARTRAAPHEGIYAPEATRLVYARLSSLVGDITFGGFAVIVDAAFLGYPVRESFRELARGLGLPLWIVSCQSSAATCRRRVKRREAAMNDASEAGVSVFENQRLTSEPLSAGELTHTLIIDTECDPATLRSRIDELAVRARKGPPSAVQPEARRASRGSQ